MWALNIPIIVLSSSARPGCIGGAYSESVAEFEDFLVGGVYSGSVADFEDF